MTDRIPMTHGGSDETRAEHERLSDWDAAYVLGALSPSDRRAFEQHLAECPSCSSGVRDLAGMPGLLGTLDRDEAMSLLEDAASTPGVALPDAPDLVPALLHRVRRRRRIRRWSIAAALVGAAAVAAVVALVVPSVITAPPPVSVATSLQQVGETYGGDSPLSATVTLTSDHWGTSVGMVCRWNADSSWSPETSATKRWDYGLWVIQTDGKSDRVVTWSAGPGDVVRTSGSTAIPTERISRIELRSLDTGKVLLASNVHASGAG
jgi:hypothetical protein